MAKTQTKKKTKTDTETMKVTGVFKEEKKQLTTEEICELIDTIKIEISLQMLLENKLGLREIMQNSDYPTVVSNSIVWSKIQNKLVKRVPKPILENIQTSLNKITDVIRKKGESYIQLADLIEANNK